MQVHILHVGEWLPSGHWVVADGQGVRMGMVMCEIVTCEVVMRVCYRTQPLQNNRLCCGRVCTETWMVRRGRKKGGKGRR